MRCSFSELNPVTVSCRLTLHYSKLMKPPQVSYLSVCYTGNFLCEDLVSHFLPMASLLEDFSPAERGLTALTAGPSRGVFTLVEYRSKIGLQQDFQLWP